MTFVFAKLLYVSLYTVFGSAIPYLALFYDGTLHLDSKQIGLLLAIAPFVQSLACPIWTVLVDRKPQWHGPIMSMMAVTGGVAIMTLNLLPSWFDTKADCVDCKSTNVLMVTAALAFIFAFFGQPVSALVDSAVLKMLGDQKLLYGNQRLWGSISNGINILIVGLWISSAGINVAFYVFGFGVTLFAILAVFTRFPAESDERVDHDEISHPYDGEVQPLLRKPQSIQRPYVEQPGMASSFFSALGSVLTQHSTNNDISHRPYLDGRRDSSASYANTEFLEEYDERPLNLLRTTTSVAALDVQMEASHQIANLDHLPSLGLALSHIPSVDTSFAAFADLAGPEPIRLEKSTLRSPHVWTFLVMTLLFGVSYSMIAQFLFLFMRNDLGMESSLIGWTGPIGGIAEVSTFWISNKLLEDYSVTSLITYSHVVVIARNLVYTILVPNDMVSIATALGLQLVNGSAYALAWATAVSEVDSFFPPEQRSTAQGILAALFTGLGFGLGCILGGSVYDLYGSKALCQASAVVAVLSLAVFLVGRSQRSM